VATLDPADLARQVDVDAAITVAFTRPLHPLSLSADTFRLLDGATPVIGALFASADGRSAIFRPAAPLRGLAPYTIELSPELHDVFGNPLAGNQSDGRYVSDFETWDTAPPPRPTPGRITLSIPRDGETEVRGSIGTLAPGTLVFVFNLRRERRPPRLQSRTGASARLAADSETRSLFRCRALLERSPRSRRFRSRISQRGGSAVSARGRFASSAAWSCHPPRSFVRTDELSVVELPVPPAADLPAGLVPLRAFHLPQLRGLAPPSPASTCSRNPARSRARSGSPLRFGSTSRG
jgi:hypothetical protein